jgi:hypothetical protein
VAVPQIVVTKDWVDPDSTVPASGTVRFDLTGQLIIDGTAVTPRPAIAQLVAGTIAQPLTPTDDGDSPALYWVTEDIQGSPTVRYAVQVPSAPPGSRAVSDGVTVQGDTTVTSATAAWTGGDVGKVVWSPAFPVGTTVASVTNGTTAVLSAPATLAATGVHLLIGAQVDLTSLDPITQD